MHIICGRERKRKGARALEEDKEKVEHMYTSIIERHSPATIPLTPTLPAGAAAAATPVSFVQGRLGKAASFRDSTAACLSSHATSILASSSFATAYSVFTRTHARGTQSGMRARRSASLHPSVCIICTCVCACVRWVSRERREVVGRCQASVRARAVLFSFFLLSLPSFVCVYTRPRAASF